jgi:predicted metal-dependent phosphoesterase TrpH
MPGTKFVKCDLHIHTPSSNCYKDKSVTPDQIVQAALNKGLSLVAITDHNTVDGIQGVIEAAKGTELVVFPGFELTAEGGHLIEPRTQIGTAQVQS